MHLRPWLCLAILFSVPTAPFYLYKVVDSLPDPVEPCAMKGSQDLPYDTLQDVENPADVEVRGVPPTLKMT